MKTTVKEPEIWKRVIDVEIPVETVEAAFGEKLSKYQRTMKLPGFRPGKVPPAMIKSRFGGAIKAEIVEDLIEKAFTQACTENHIVPITQAKVNNLKADDGQPMSITIETEVDPKVEIKGYDKLKVKMSVNKVKPAQVDDVVKDLRERLAEFKDVDRSSKKGDFLTIEYVKVVVDGSDRPDITSPKYPIEVGESKIKEFDKALVGKSAGDLVDISFKFPKDYADNDIANKAAAFTVKVTKVQERVLPEINEEFLKKVGDVKSEEELRQKVLEDLESRELDRAKNEACNQAIDKLIKDNPFDVPPSRVDSYIGYMVEETKKYARPGEPEISREDADVRYRETGIKTLKRFIILNYISGKENIRATTAEVDEQIQKMADRYNQPFDKVKEALRSNGTTNRIRDDLREQHTLDFLIGEYTPVAIAEVAAPVQE